MRKKIVLKVSLITVSILLSLFIVGMVIFCLCFPKDSASIMYDIGLENISQSLYYRDYKKTQSLNSLYNSLSINIKLNNSKNIIKQYELLSGDGNYNLLVETYASSVMQSNKNAYIKASSYDLDDYLSNKYLDALIKSDLKEKAFKYATANSNFESDLSFINLKKYTYHNFLKDVESIEKNNPLFYEEIDGVKIFDVIKEYYADLNGYLENHKADSFENDKVYKIALTDRIIEVGMDLLSLNNYNSITFSIDREETNNRILYLKNEYLRELLW